jgi:hypothetical protein
MAFFTAEVFSRRHGGFEGLARFVEMCERGCPDCRHHKQRCKLKHIAREFSLSVSEVCQLRLKLMRRVWQPEEGLRNYLDFHRMNAEREYKERRAIIVRLKDGSLAE